MKHYINLCSELPIFFAMKFLKIALCIHKAKLSTFMSWVLKMFTGPTPEIKEIVLISLETTRELITGNPRWPIVRVLDEKLSQRITGE